MGYLFHLIFYQPLLNLLVFFYNVIPGHDLGIAIILITVFIKLILYPLSAQSIKSQKALQALQPKVEALKKQHKDQKEILAAELMKLYKAEKVNPMSSCLPLLIQFPFLIAVYQVFRTGLSDGALGNLYPFIASPGRLNNIAFGFLDFAKPQIVLAVLAGLAQFWQAKMMVTKKPAINTPGSQDESMMATMNKQMVYMMPIMTIFIGVSLPGGLVFYWLVVTVLSALQQIVVFRKKTQSV